MNLGADSSEWRGLPDFGTGRHLEPPILGGDSSEPGVLDWVVDGGGFDREEVTASSNAQVLEALVMEERLEGVGVALLGGQLWHGGWPANRQAARCSGWCEKRPRNVQRNGCASKWFQCLMKPSIRSLSSLTLLNSP